MLNKENLDSFSKDISKLIDYQFKNKDLLIESFTHKSISNKNYERLEFLGDAVLQLIITRYLYKTYPTINEGILSREKQLIVSRKTISKLSLDLGLVNLLISKNLNYNTSASLKNTLAANIIESLIGALFIDSNYEKCEEVVIKMFSKYLTIKEDIGSKDSKTLLQEYMQSKNISLPVYKTIKISGPPHQPNFKITCRVPVYNETFSSISNTVREGQQKVSQIILEKISDEKKI